MAFPMVPALEAAVLVEAAALVGAGVALVVAGVALVACAASVALVVARPRGPRAPLAAPKLGLRHAGRRRRRANIKRRKSLRFVNRARRASWTTFEGGYRYR